MFSVLQFLATRHTFDWIWNHLWRVSQLIQCWEEEWSICFSNICIFDVFFFCFLLSLKTTHFMITLCLPFQVGMIEGLTSFTAMFSGQEGGNERWTRMEDVFPKGTWGFSIASLPAMLVYQRARSTMNRARWVVDFRCSQLIPTGRCRKIAVPCRDRCPGLGNLGSLWPLGKNILPPQPERMSPVQRDHFYRKWIIF